VRLLPALLLLPSVSIWADDAQLREPRAWRCRVEARAISDEPEGGAGREEQLEVAEFLLVTEPPRVSVVAPRLEFRMREGEGSFALKIDTRAPGEGEGTKVTTRGGSGGRLHLHAEGWFEPESGAYALALRADPDRLVALVTMSGIEDGRFRTFRHAESRPSYLASFSAEGKAETGGRAIRGTRTVTDASAGLRRRVELSWTLERVDPAIEGRVVDHRGRPLAGVKVIARTTSAERARKRLPPIALEGVTDTEGRFWIDAFLGLWRVEAVATVLRTELGTLVVAGAEVEAPAEVRFDRAPRLDVTLETYRLAALPRADLLDRAFSGDAARYLEFLRARHAPDEMRAALAP
jgi:hypothetical protein